MEEVVKKSIRRFWRNRVLLGIGGLAALGFSVLQIKAVIQHQPQQPSWSLEFSRSLEELLEKRTRGEDNWQEREDLLQLAQARTLRETELALVLEQAREHVLERELEHVLEQAREHVLEQELEYMLNHVLERELERERVLELVLEYPLGIEKVLMHPLMIELQLPLEQAQLQSLERLQSLEQSLEDSRILEHSLVRDLERARARTSATLLKIATEELQQVHGVTLQQDSELEALLSLEPTRTRALLQSAILLTISSFLLLAATLALYRAKSPYKLPTTAHSVAFLPEEYAAEIGALHQRMRKSKASEWEIRLRLCEEFLTLLWVFYIQIRLDNLRLPFGDRTIDD